MFRSGLILIDDDAIRLAEYNTYMLAHRTGHDQSICRSLVQNFRSMKKHVNFILPTFIYI